jgi:uncharacterized protein (TIGR02391 family)
MTTGDSIQHIVSIIRRQQNALVRIYESAEKEQNPLLALERIRRWKIRTVEIMSKDVRQSDGKRLEQTMFYFNDQLTPMENLAMATTTFHNFLTALTEDIQLNPREFDGTKPSPAIEATDVSVVVDQPLIWEQIHPAVTQVAKSRFESGHYADSVEAAFKEINRKVKLIVKNQLGEELDGASLMNKAFSPQNPIIRVADLSDETGRDMQKGYHQIFAGSMIGIRNPKAHDNLIIDRIRAIHFIYLASLLMSKVDERV